MAIKFLIINKLHILESYKLLNFLDLEILYLKNFDCFDETNDENFGFDKLLLPFTLKLVIIDCKKNYAIKPSKRKEFITNTKNCLKLPFNCDLIINFDHKPEDYFEDTIRKDNKHNMYIYCPYVTNVLYFNGSFYPDCKRKGNFLLKSCLTNNKIVSTDPNDKMINDFEIVKFLHNTFNIYEDFEIFDIKAKKLNQLININKLIKL